MRPLWAVVIMVLHYRRFAVGIGRLQVGFGSFAINCREHRPRFTIVPNAERLASARPG
jgi:hypothetical protein